MGRKQGLSRKTKVNILFVVNTIVYAWLTMQRVEAGYYNPELGLLIVVHELLQWVLVILIGSMIALYLFGRRQP